MAGQPLRRIGLHTLARPPRTLAPRTSRPAPTHSAPPPPALASASTLAAPPCTRALSAGPSPLAEARPLVPTTPSPAQSTPLAQPSPGLHHGHLCRGAPRAAATHTQVARPPQPHARRRRMRHDPYVYMYDRWSARGVIVRAATIAIPEHPIPRILYLRGPLLPWGHASAALATPLGYALGGSERS